jgi:hypothetical protein
MHEAGTGAYVLRPGESRSIDLGGFRMSVKAAGGEGPASFSPMEDTEIGPFLAGAAVLEHADANIMEPMRSRRRPAP